MVSFLDFAIHFSTESHGVQAMEQDALGSRDPAIDPGCLRFDLLRDRDLRMDPKTGSVETAGEWRASPRIGEFMDNSRNSGG